MAAVKLGPALATDVACVLVFAIVGRSSHGEMNDLVGVAWTAWPFLVGLMIGALAGRAWRRPLAVGTGGWVWAGAWLIGMLLRALTGAGTAPSFIVVAAIALGVLLIGWRAGLRTVRHARARRHRLAA